MKLKSRLIVSLVQPHLSSSSSTAAAASTLLSRHTQTRPITKVRLKWVRNRTIDHIIEKDTDLKAAMLLKDAIKQSPTGYLPARAVDDWERLLGLTIPVRRFLRRYPTLFAEFPHPRYPTLPCFSLTSTAESLDDLERSVYSSHEGEIVERLSRLLMMTKSRAIPFQSIHPLRWDLGLPVDFARDLILRYPDHFQVVKGSNGLPHLSLAKWVEDYAVSALVRSRESRGDDELGNKYRQFKKGITALSFPMSFPKGYGGQTKVKAWMEEFQKLPYISPYEDWRGLDPNSELMEKRVVGVLHELLSLTIHKKTKRNYLRRLREELGLPHKFTRIFTRYPGIFYLSLKCKTTTVAIKEGYRRGRLVDPHPLVRVREKFYHVMRTGMLYRGKGEALLVHQFDGFDDSLDVEGLCSYGMEAKEEEDEEEEEEFWEGSDFDGDTDDAEEKMMSMFRSSQGILKDL